MTEHSRRLSPSVAFVTPSYRLDRDRCALLNRSLDACAPSFEHWIVVDRGDLPHFRKLESSTTHVVTKEEVLPVWVHRVDTLRIGLRSNAWLQARGRPIRGWLLQQLVKLAVSESLNADVVLHADSDVVFLRPFTAASVTNGAGEVKLYARPAAVDGSLPHHVGWHRSAEKLLGIEETDLPLPDFISSLVAWRRENAVALLRHIERTTGRHWLRALASAWDVSEYTLYGRFAEDVLGASGQFVSEAPLCVDYYKRVPLGVAELQTFLDRARGDAIAASLTSKAGMNPRDYVAVLERFWAEPVTRPQPVETEPGATRPSAGPGEAGSARHSPAGARPKAARHVGGPRRAGGTIMRVGRSGMAAAAFALVALMMLILGLGID